MNKTVAQIIPLVLLLCLSHISSVTASAIEPPYIRYEANADLVTVDVNQLPLRNFLEKIAAETGISVETAITDEHPITMRQERVPLEAVLKNALRGTNHMLRYDTTPDGRSVLYGVRVVGHGEALLGRSSSYPAASLSAKTDEVKTQEKNRKNSPEYQEKLRVSQILQGNLKRNGIPPSTYLNVVNRPASPARGRDVEATSSLAATRMHSATGEQ